MGWTNNVMAAVCILSMIFMGCGAALGQKKPIVVITDCYHPYQDPGDNLDLINGFALPDVDLKAIILDITDAFRKDTADHETLWKDPRGPREAGIIPIMQLNYIFNRDVPFAIGPLGSMASEQDKMEGISDFETKGVELLLDVLEQSDTPVEILSFGSARVLTVAYNRQPDLLKAKIARVHLSAGTASNGYVLGRDEGANMIPGGEWNVALDVHAFNGLLKSGLPIALYPCAGKDGGYTKDTNSSYYKLHDMSFLRELDPKLQCYVDYAFTPTLRHDFLRAMDSGAPYTDGKPLQFNSFHVWESAIWLNATDRLIVKHNTDTYKLVKKDKAPGTGTIIENGLKPCIITEIRPDGRFQFEYTENESNIHVYYRPDVEENERAMNFVIPQLFKSFNSSSSDNQ